MEGRSTVAAFARRHADRLVAAAFAALVVAIRLPARSRYLNAWDGILYSLGMEHYDVAAARPHPPGSPLYVALGKVAFLFTHEANAALVSLSLVFSAVSVAFLYLLVAEIATRRAAVITTTLFLVAPLFVYDGVIAIAYTFESAASVALAWLAWRTRTSPTLSRRVALGLTWAAAVGVRQSLLFYMAPLVGWALLPHLRDWRAAARRAVPTAVAALAGALAWFVPMVLLTGYRAYEDASQIQSRGVVFAYTVFNVGWPAMRFHWDRLLIMVHAERWLLLATLLGAVAVLAATHRRPVSRKWRLGASFFAVWVAPTLAFHLLVFNGLGNNAYGYALTFLPAVYALYGIILDALVEQWSPTSAQARRAVGAVAVVVLLLPGLGLGLDARQYWRQEVRDHDLWADSWSHLPDSFPPNETALLGYYTWAHAKWYFPQYVLWSYQPAVYSGWNWTLTLQSQYHEDDVKYYPAHREGPFRAQHPIPANVHRVVLLDFQLAGENGEPRRIVDNVTIHEGQLDNGWRILYFDIDNHHPTIESYFQDWPWFVHTRLT